MKVVWLALTGSLDIPTLGIRVTAGEPVELPDAVAEELVARGDFKAAKRSTSKTEE